MMLEEGGILFLSVPAVDASYHFVAMGNSGRTYTQQRFAELTAGWKALSVFAVARDGTILQQAPSDFWASDLLPTQPKWDFQPLFAMRRKAFDR